MTGDELFLYFYIVINLIGIVYCIYMAFKGGKNDSRF